MHSLKAIALLGAGLLAESLAAVPLAGQFDCAAAHVRADGAEAQAIVARVLAAAEPPDDSTRVARSLEQASLSLLRDGRPEQAIPLLHRVVRLRADCAALQAHAFAGLAQSYDHLFHRPGTSVRDSASKYHRLAVETAERSGVPWLLASMAQDAGVWEGGLGNYTASRSYLDKGEATARGMNDAAMVAMILLNQAILAERLNNRREALAKILEAQRISWREGNVVGIARAEMILGEHWQDGGRPDLSEPLLESALQIITRYDTITELVDLRPRALAALGSVEAATGRYAHASRHYYEAIAGWRDLGDEPAAAQASLAYANNLVHMDSLEVAEEVYAEAESIFRRRGDYGNVAAVISWRIPLYLLREDSLAAVSTAHHLLALADTLQDPSVKASALIALGNLIVSKDPQTALTYYTEARRLDDSRIRRAGYYQNLAIAYSHWTEPRELGRAVAYSDSALAEIGRWYLVAGGDAAQVGLRSAFSSWFGPWAEGWVQRADDPLIGTRMAAVSALAVAERGRTRAFLQLLGTSDPDTRAGRDLMAEAMPLLDQVRSTGAVAALYYYSTESSLLTWLILPDGSTYVTHAAVTADSLHTLVRALRAALGVEAGCDARRAADHRVADGLIAALSELVLPAGLRERLPPSGELLLIPQGALSLLPFAVLRLPGGTDELLGLRYALRYSPSLAILQAVEGRHPPMERRDLMGQAIVVANPMMPLVNVCDVEFVPSSLLGAEESGKRVGAMLHSIPLIGPSATEERIRAALPSARVIYFATHGFAYDSELEARASFITLSPSAPAAKGTDLPTDGRLTVDEILADLQPLRAELVVLSACQTGLGQLTEGEGTVGLQRAFLARGARTVLVSLWPVDDGASAVLVDEFFRQWLEVGVSKTEALRKAQLHVRSQSGWSHPRYWAAFQLTGGG